MTKLGEVGERERMRERGKKKITKKAAVKVKEKQNQNSVHKYTTVYIAMCTACHAHVMRKIFIQL